MTKTDQLKRRVKARIGGLLYRQVLKVKHEMDELEWGFWQAMARQSCATIRRLFPLIMAEIDAAFASACRVVQKDLTKRARRG